jgi:hypothetical protein
MVERRLLNILLLKINPFRTFMHHSRKTPFNIIHPLTTRTPKRSLHIFSTTFQHALPTFVLMLLAPHQSTYHKILKRLSLTVPLGLEQNVRQVCAHQVTARFTSVSDADPIQVT